MESWVFLLVGSLGAVGAAMTLGTIAAMVRYRRTGTLPGTGAAPGEEPDPEDPGRDAGPAGVDPEPAVMRRLVIRIVLGAVVAAVCFAVLAEQGLLGGPILG